MEICNSDFGKNVETNVETNTIDKKTDLIIYPILVDIILIQKFSQLAFYKTDPDGTTR